MKTELLKELIEETEMDDIAERYQLGDVYKRQVLIPARNRKIKQEYNGWNSKELAEKYEVTTRMIAKILHDVPIPQQMDLSQFIDYEKY